VPKITAIQRQKRNPHRYSIFVDGEFAVGVDEQVMVDLGLRPQQSVNTETLEQIATEEQISQARAAAMRLLEYRPRSRGELTRRLHQQGFDSQTISRVIDRLVELDLVNDERFARQMIQSLTRSRNLGKQAIFEKLRQAGISRELAEAVIEQELADYDESQQAREAVEKYLPRLADIEPASQRRRLYGYLRRRGFSYEVIRQVIAAVGNGE